jgi:ABC-type phosphate transport system substrate-binding protein
VSERIKTPARPQTRAVLLGLIFVLALVPLSGHTDQISPETHYCDGTAQPASGEGSKSQVSVHADIFAPAFAKACPSEAGVVSYQGTGDAAGVRAITLRRRHFGAADVPLSTNEKVLAEFGDHYWTSPIHQIPLYINGWAIAYNVPCSGPAINFSATNLSLIYSGTIVTWDDTRLVNPDNMWLANCHESIRLTRRADAGGATTVFQDYLSKRNPQWNIYKRQLLGSWPSNNFACAGIGETGMANCLTFRGAIGYVEIAVARSAGLQTGKLENGSLAFVAATAAGCSAAAGAAVLPPGTSPVTLPDGTKSPWVPATMGDWSVVSITDAPNGITGPASYPFCSFSYVFVLQHWFSGFGGTVPGPVARGVVDYLLVALQPATQAKLAGVGFAPLPEKVRQISLDGVNHISFSRLTTFGV